MRGCSFTAPPRDWRRLPPQPRSPRQAALPPAPPGAGWAPGPRGSRLCPRPRRESGGAARAALWRPHGLCSAGDLWQHQFQSLDSKSLHTPLTALQQEQIQQLSHKRLQRMPVQYVLGEWDFQDLTLKMRPPVFIPRPETEDLVSLVVEEEFQKCENSALCFPVPVPHPVILEIGCGSGAIALSLLRKLPQSRVIAMDKEEAAVDLTRENAHRLQLQERIHIIHQDVSHSCAKQLLLWGPIDVIVSNPPYVFHEDMASLDAEILRYEDLDALDGGDDGMRVIKTILALAPSLLKVSGSVFLEVDPRHPDMVEHWLQAQPDLLLTLRAVHEDFCGKPRFLHIQKQSSWQLCET
ncbi:MTRF1L release factor glutamine methyltransferase isoform X2 [Prinia subflava]|uniref:MTRF1L release factor glutamine methyltransferase isoform X2 n=1 Tax=Prinia subflava TaxID=208062 RepID=UPI002FE18943